MKGGIFNVVPPSYDNKYTLLIDADYLAYQVGGLSQHKDRPKDRDDCTLVCLDEDQDIWTFVEPEGLVRWKVVNEIQKLQARLRTKNIRVFLTGKGNFREDIAVTRKYKGNRTSLRPYYFDYVRSVLAEEFDAEIVDGIEADDFCSIEHTKDDSATVVVSQDKDLINSPGLLYVPRQDSLYNVTPEWSLSHLLYQLVCGDTVDAIPGLKGRGKAWYAKNPDIEVIYREYYRQDPTGALLHEQLNLLHMMQYGDVAGEYTEDMLWRRAEGLPIVVWDRKEFEEECNVHLD